MGKRSKPLAIVLIISCMFVLSATFQAAIAGRTGDVVVQNVEVREDVVDVTLTNQSGSRLTGTLELEVSLEDGTTSGVSVSYALNGGATATYSVNCGGALSGVGYVGIQESNEPM